MNFSIRNITVLALAGILPCLTLEAQPSWAPLISSGFSTGMSNLSALFTRTKTQPANNEQGAGNSPYYTKGNVAVATLAGVSGLMFFGYLCYRTNALKKTIKALEAPNQTNTANDVEQQYYFEGDLSLNLRDNPTLLEKEIKNLTKQEREVYQELECHTFGNNELNQDKYKGITARLQGLNQLKTKLQNN